MTRITNDLLGFRIAANGSLSPIPGTPVPLGNSPIDLAISPDGAFLYAINLGGNTSGYAIDPSTGGLTPIPGQPFPALGVPLGTTIASP